MSDYLIMYTSSSEGITVGVSDDTLAGALDAMVQQFGDGVVPLVASTIDELERTAKAVEDVSDVEELRQSGLVVERRDDGPGSDAGVPVPEDDEPPAVRDDVDEGTGGEASASAPATHFCSVCGDEITADRAKASQLMMGEDRCADCTA